VAARGFNDDVGEDQALLNPDLRHLSEVDRLCARLANRMIFMFFNSVWPYSDHIWRENSPSFESRRFEGLRGLGHTVAEYSFSGALFPFN
jgi:hypothetical protein